MSDCDEIAIVTDNFLIKKTNTIATNVTSTASISCHIKKVRRLLYFSYSLTNDHITIDSYYYFLSLYKTKMYNIKWKIMSFEKFGLKIVCAIISRT